MADPGSPCDLCGEDTTPDVGPWDWYMVQDAVWEAAGMPTVRGFLHRRCLEHRLGRSLTPEDFTDAPVNRMPLGPLNA